VSSPAPAAPTLTLVKTERDATAGGLFVRGPLAVNVGDRIDYQIVVTNTSGVPVAVLIDDRGCRIRGGATLRFVGVQFPPGTTLTYHCSHVIAKADGPVYSNTAMAAGTSAAAAATPVSSTVTANVAQVLGAHKAIAHKVVAHKAAAKHTASVTHTSAPAHVAVAKHKAVAKHTAVAKHKAAAKHGAAPKHATKPAAHAAPKHVTKVTKKAVPAKAVDKGASYTG
jgi:hypothetical protein